MKAYLEAVRKSSVFAAHKRQMSALLGLAAGERLLDVGCGLGDDVIAAAAAVGPSGLAIGVEADDATLTALAHGPERPAHAAFVGGRAECLPFPDGSFDVVRIERLLHLLPAPDEALREARRVVRPRGRILVAEPFWNTLAIRGPHVGADPVTARLTAPQRPMLDRSGLGAAIVAAGLHIAGEHPMVARFTDAGEARLLLHLDRDMFAMILRKEIAGADALRWRQALERDAAEGAFEASLGGAVLSLRPACAAPVA